MAEPNVATISPFTALDRVPGLRQLALLVGLALSISIGVTAAFWVREPSYSLLYSNISDREAGEIVEILGASEIPHELDRKSGAILVAGDRLHEARLMLASQGLPRGAGFGLEIIEGDTGFSTSQFMENARYHHALETELARTISNLRPVQHARVHLAIPKSTVFLRQKKKPSASVLVYLYPGRTLEQAQVASIVHLVASSISDLDSSEVTVVDQQGRLLSTPDDASELAMTVRQFDYVRRLEDTYVDRIINLLTPMLGPNRVRATVSAELDFTLREETREDFDPESTVVRSEQVSEDRSVGGAANGGIPGALSNQPPPAGQQAAVAAGTSEGEAPPVNESSRRTRNFELDRTLSKTRQPTGTIQRLSVAVLVDDRRITQEDGTVTTEPLSTTELDEMTRLVREAVGFNDARGDSVSVSNVSFFEQPEAPPPEEPGFLSRPGIWDAAKQILGAGLLIALVLVIIRPIVKTLSTGLGAPAPAAIASGYAPVNVGPASGAAPGSTMPAAAPPAPLSFDDKVTVARQIADQNPERVAQIVRAWVQTDD
jgi:flagellar M-ring protein FliF